MAQSLVGEARPRLVPELEVGCTGCEPAWGGRSGVAVGEASECPPAVGVLDDPLAFEGGEGVTEAQVVAVQRLAELAAVKGPLSATQGREDAVGERLRRRSRVGAVVGLRVADDFEVGGGAVGAGDEPELDGAGSGGGAVLGDEDDPVGAVAMGQVGGVVGPGVEIAGASEGLAEVGAAAFAHVVNEDDGDVVLSLELAQEAEQPRDVSAAVLVEAVKSHEGIEEEEPGLAAREGGAQTCLVGGEIEAQAGRGDHEQVERGERQTAVQTHTSDAVSHPWQRILGEVDECGAWVIDGEAAEARSAGGDADGEVETEPALARLGHASDDADGMAGPDLAHQPGVLRGSDLEVGGPCDGELWLCGRSGTHGQRTFRAATMWPAQTTVALARAAIPSASRARESMARRLPRLIS